MTNAQPEGTPSGSPRDEVIEDAVVVDEAPPVLVEPAHPTAEEPIVATVDPGAVEVASPVIEPEVEAEPEAAAPAQQIIYLHAPAQPSKLGNRGVGTLLALASTVIFLALLALGTALVGAVVVGRLSFTFLGSAEFYVPVLFFAIASVVLALVANRASWWAHILGSLVVALVVYFGTIGLGLLGAGIVLNTPAEAAARFAQQLGNPFVVLSGLLAREVSIWAGALISRRGRKVKARNQAAFDDYERDLAEKRAEHERAVSAATPV